MQKASDKPITLPHSSSTWRVFNGTRAGASDSITSATGYIGSEAEWLSGSVFCFATTGPRFKPQAGQGRLSLSSFQ
ncbi:hypothetical protein TNCV_1276721 [Trichonephila clavipes]|nr:hypothetical protein TNCV_1276721 [Trichonephila clavipes]